MSSSIHPDLFVAITGPTELMDTLVQMLAEGPVPTPGVPRLDEWPEGPSVFGVLPDRLDACFSIAIERTEKGVEMTILDSCVAAD